MPHWWDKVPNYKPPQVNAKSVYELEGTMTGKVVVIVAPGPSLDLFPKKRLEDFTTIGVNSALELVPRLDYWVFQEGIIGKRYHPLYTTGRCGAVVTTRDRIPIMEKVLPGSVGLYKYTYYDTSVLRMPREVDFYPYWRRPEIDFLPGRCTITANALSLAVLMRPRMIVFVGLDFFIEGEKYYADGVKRNTGPRLRKRALSAGSAMMYIFAKHQVWAGVRKITTSPWLRMKGIVNLELKEALKEMKGGEK